MKYIFNLLIALAISLVSLHVLAADDRVKVNFSGSINAYSCNVSSAAQNVNLGIWFLEGDGSNFPRNSATDWVEFELNFNCLGGYRQVIGAIEGTPSTLNRNFFALDNIEGSATGMAIEIEAYSPERKRWEPKNPNEVSTLIGMANITYGNNVVQLRARYKQLANVATPGYANASVTFVVRNN
ncbi:fimbrial protein [Providencia rettgeri]|uniref:fimbrial protein n=1 Tax=Providencia rettgeri TaxID=587 RepID=UPI0034E0CE21